MEYRFKMARAAIYVNEARKTLAAIRAETGADVIINGGLYDMGKFRAACHLKADGYLYAEDQYRYWGFGWNNGDAALQMVAEYDHLDNYICCVALIKDGKKQKLIYDSGVGGRRARSAVATLANGDIVVYCSMAGMTPEELQTYALTQGWVNALMLDGGGSCQCLTPEKSVSSDRIVHNVLCFWTEKKENAGGDDSMYKIALGAGHGIDSAGKRCMKALDPNETREWWLNDRVCDYVEQYLAEYEGYQLLRTDDSDDGKDNIDLDVRAAAANDWGADVYLSVHHNAGANGTAAGGIVAFCHTKAGATEIMLRDELYNALIAHTGLKGNRYTPKTTADFQILRETKMPAVLLELGFMDSRTDVPVILTDTYAQNCARAIVEVLVARGGLQRRREPAEQPEDTFSDIESFINNMTDEQAYRVMEKAQRYAAQAK